VVGRTEGKQGMCQGWGHWPKWILSSPPHAEPGVTCIRCRKSIENQKCTHDKEFTLMTKSKNTPLEANCLGVSYERRIKRSLQEFGKLSSRSGSIGHRLHKRLSDSSVILRSQDPLKI